MGDFKTILVTTDFSDTSCQAVAPAQMLARKLGAKIILVHVSEPFVPYAGEHYIPDVEAINKQVHARARQDLEQFAAKHFGSHMGVELVSAVGVPHLEILNLARQRAVDLVVMAMHGRGFISHAVFGSTTERVLRQAPCPVLVIRDQSVK